MIKTCSTCGMELEISNFHKGSRYKGGYRGQCKNCTAAKNRDYRETEKGKESSREASRKWRDNNLEKSKASKRRWYWERGGKEYHQSYRMTPSGRNVLYQAIARYRKTAKYKSRFLAYCLKNRSKRLAKDAVNRAVKRGEIPPVSTQTCRNCNHQAHHYHHDSYDTGKWLDVIPLCATCHARRHDDGNLFHD